MQEAAAVPLRAVRKMQQEFLQAQIAMTHKRVAVQQRALIQQYERFRVQQSLIAEVASSADADSLRELRERDPQFPAFTGRTDHFLHWLRDAKPARSSVISRMPLPSNTQSWRCVTPFGVFFLQDRPFHRQRAATPHR